MNEIFKIFVTYTFFDYLFLPHLLSFSFSDLYSILLISFSLSQLYLYHLHCMTQSPVILLHFLSPVTCGNMRHSRMLCGLPTWVQAVEHCPSVIDLKCCVIHTLGPGSKLGGNLVDSSCLCRVAPTAKRTASYEVSLKCKILKHSLHSSTTLWWTSITQTWSNVYRLASSFIHQHSAVRFKHWGRDNDVNTCLFPDSGWYLRSGKASSSFLSNVALQKPLRQNPGRGQELDGLPLLCIPSSPLFAYYFGFFQRNYPRQGLVWSIVTLKLTVCSFSVFFGLACNSTSAYVSGPSHSLLVKKGASLSLFRFRDHIE